jgi:predicted porin
MLKHDWRQARWDATLKRAGPIVATLGVNKVQNAKAGYSLGGRYSFGGFAVAASYNQATRVNARRRGFSLGGQATMGAATLTLDVTRDTKNECR